MVTLSKPAWRNKYQGYPTNISRKRNKICQTAIHRDIQIGHGLQNIAVSSKTGQHLENGQILFRGSSYGYRPIEDPDLV